MKYLLIMLLFLNCDWDHIVPLDFDNQIISYPVSKSVLGVWFSDSSIIEIMGGEIIFHDSSKVYIPYYKPYQQYCEAPDSTIKLYDYYKEQGGDPNEKHYSHKIYWHRINDTLSIDKIDNNIHDPLVGKYTRGFMVNPMLLGSWFALDPTILNISDTLTFLDSAAYIEEAYCFNNLKTNNEGTYNYKVRGHWLFLTEYDTIKSLGTDSVKYAINEDTLKLMSKKQETMKYVRQ